MDLPFMFTTVTDHLAQTAHLSPEAMGAYEALRCHYWLRQGALPMDDKQLARLARMTPAEWKRVADDVVGLFTITEDGLYHEALEADLARARKRSDEARKKADKRWNSNTPAVGKPASGTNHSTAGADATASPEQCHPYPDAPPPKGGGARDPHSPLVENLVDKSVDNSGLVCKHCGFPSQQRPGKDAFCHNRDCAVWMDDALQQEFVKPEDFVPREGVPV